jgi:hypothetical protein
MLHLDHCKRTGGSTTHITLELRDDSSSKRNPGAGEVSTHHCSWLDTHAPQVDAQQNLCLK